MNAPPSPVTDSTPSRAVRVWVVFYRATCYLVFLGTFLYAVGFVGNLVVPKSIDSGPAVPLTEAVVVNVLLLGLFAVQHSVMARPAFKRWWTRAVPSPVERCTYVLASSLALILLFWLWRPMPGVAWEAESPWSALLWAVFGVGWAVVLVSTFLIDHFDLFGLRQVVLFARGQPYTPPPFRARGLYRVVRHPIMVGFLIAFWATPAMAWGHLLFAGMTTAYIVVGVWLEERDMRRPSAAATTSTADGSGCSSLASEEIVRPVTVPLMNDLDPHDGCAIAHRKFTIATWHQATDAFGGSWAQGNG